MRPAIIAIGLRGLLLLALLLGTPVFAQVHTRLSQSSIAAGDSVTLNIEVEDARATPELAPLEADFVVLRMDSGRQVEIRNGRIQSRQRFAVEMRPRRSGQIDIPALKVGSQYSQPLTLQVADAAPVADVQPQAQAGQAVFLETHVSDSAPYVQQAVSVTLRLHYAVNLFGGELQQPQPANASLVPLGDDSRSRRVIDGQEYRVLERHYLLIPERSGELVLPAAWFRGEGERIGAAGWFGAGRVHMQANAPAQRLEVRPIPANAPTPWLPARGLSVRVLDVEQEGQVGQGITLKLELHADGATASQLPPLELAPHPQLQVFAEPAEAVEGVHQGRLQSTVIRQFTLLPLAAGELLVQVKPISWWDVSAQRMRRTELAPIRLNIAEGSLQQAPAPLIAQAGQRQAAESATAKASPAWHGWLLGGLILAVVMAVAWLFYRRRQWQTQKVSQQPVSRQALQQALHSGDLPAIARLLPGIVMPAAASLSELRTRLVSEAQREAIDMLELALWGGGDAEAARRQLRTAFADVHKRRSSGKQAAPLLPPLYPER